MTARGVFFSFFFKKGPGIGSPSRKRIFGINLGDFLPINEELSQYR